MLGFRERRFRRDRIAIAHGGGDIVRRIRPDHRRTGRQRIGGTDGRRQNLVINDDGLCRRLRISPRWGEYDRDRLACKPDNVMRQQTPRRRGHRRAIRPLEDRQGRDGADIVHDQIGSRIDGGNARHGHRRAGIDRRDPGVGVRRAQHVEPQRAVLRLVVDEMSLPCEKPLIFETLDGLSRAEAQVGGQNVHRCSFKPDWTRTKPPDRRHPGPDAGSA